MRINQIICLTLLLLSVVPSATSFAQKSPRARSIRLDKAKPSVYVSFVRFGFRKPVYTGESNERVWLRLHNNTRWPLVIDAHGAGGEAFALRTETEVGLFVSVEEVPRLRELYVLPSPSTDPPAPPPGSSGGQPLQDQPSVTAKTEEEENCSPPYRDSCHVCSTIKLASGRYIEFSVPREMVCENRKIFVVYNYEWEGRARIMADEPEHRVYFYGSDLPKDSK